MTAWWHYFLEYFCMFQNANQSNQMRNWWLHDMALFPRILIFDVASDHSIDNEMCSIKHVYVDSHAVLHHRLTGESPHQYIGT